MYNERDSRTSKHQIILDGIDMPLKSINQSINQSNNGLSEYSLRVF